MRWIWTSRVSLTMTKAGYQFVRYADDVVIVCRSEKEAAGALHHARTELGRLKLELNEEKTSRHMKHQLVA
jgi:hypothetical protein